VAATAAVPEGWQNRVLLGDAMLVEAPDDAGAVGFAAVAGERDPRRRDDLQVTRGARAMLRL
jgi:hypothetical protein